MNVMSATFLVLSVTAYASLYERYSLLFYLLKSMKVNSWHVFSWYLLYSLHHSVGELLTVTANTVPYQTKKSHFHKPIPCLWWLVLLWGFYQSLGKAETLSCWDLPRNGMAKIGAWVYSFLPVSEPSVRREVSVLNSSWQGHSHLATTVLLNHSVLFAFWHYKWVKYLYSHEPFECPLSSNLKAHSFFLSGNLMDVDIHTYHKHHIHIDHIHQMANERLRM